MAYPKAEVVISEQKVSELKLTSRIFLVHSAFTEYECLIHVTWLHLHASFRGYINMWNVPPTVCIQHVDEHLSALGKSCNSVYNGVIVYNICAYQH